MKKYIVISACVVFFATFAIVNRGVVRTWYDNLYKPDVPTPESYVQTQRENDLSDSIATITHSIATTTLPSVVSKPQQQRRTLKKELNLAIPFQSQAPFADWGQPYQEACEEASIIMVDAYLQDSLLTKEIMKERILAMVDWQMKNWGGHHDLPIMQVAELTQALYGYSVRIIPDLTIEKIKVELNKGNPVIVPTAGRELGNPNFRQPGPIYHMLVIKGYTADGLIITNDPGTRKGADYTYKPEVLMAALHDWSEPDAAPTGPKTGLIIVR